MAAKTIMIDHAAMMGVSSVELSGRGKPGPEPGSGPTSGPCPPLNDDVELDMSGRSLA